MTDDDAALTNAEIRQHDRTQHHPTPGPRNSLQYWTDAKPIWRVVLNYVFVLVARIAPSFKLRNWAFRRIGVAVGRSVSWGLEATSDMFWPELVTIEDDAIIDYDLVVLCHEFLQDEYRTGEVVVGERAMIDAKATILPGVHIGEGARAAASSLVTHDVPAGETVAGVPARPMSGDGTDGT